MVVFLYLPELVQWVLDKETGRAVDTINPNGLDSSSVAAGAKTLGKALQYLALRSEN